MRQKLRIKWLKEGEQNKKYFHHAIKERRKRNNIVGIQSREGVLVEDVSGIRSEVLKVFEDKFKERINSIPSLNTTGFSRLSEEERIFLDS